MTDELTRTLETTERDFKRLTTIVESEPLVLLFLDHPLIALAEKERVLERAIENDLTRRLLRVLIALRKSRRTRDVYETFADIVRRELAMVEAEVRVPRPLRPEEEAVLRRAIEEWTGRRVRLDVKLDEAVIGGVRVQVSGHVIDNTLRTRLENIKESLLAV
jgi:F-type H+-transporting ATPase subunit delta